MNEELSQEEQDQEREASEAEAMKFYHPRSAVAPFAHLSREEKDCEKCGGNRVRREQGGSKEDEDWLRCPDCGNISVD